jgi:hypothetical protein
MNLKNQAREDRGEEIMQWKITSPDPKLVSEWWVKVVPCWVEMIRGPRKGKKNVVINFVPQSRHRAYTPGFPNLTLRKAAE